MTNSKILLCIAFASIVARVSAVRSKAFARHWVRNHYVRSLAQSPVLTTKTMPVLGGDERSLPPQYRRKRPNTYTHYIPGGQSGIVCFNRREPGVRDLIAHGVHKIDIQILQEEVHQEVQHQVHHEVQHQVHQEVQEQVHQEVQHQEKIHEETLVEYATTEEQFHHVSEAYIQQMSQTTTVEEYQSIKVKYEAFVQRNIAKHGEWHYITTPTYAECHTH